MADSDSSEPVQVDPALSSVDEKATPVNPNKVQGLARLPNDVKATVTTADETILRLTKLIKTTAGLGAGLSTLNYSIYLLAHLHAQAPTRAAVITYISRLIGRTPSMAPPGKLSPEIAASPLLPVGAMVADLRTTLRLTGLLPLYVLLKSLIAQRNNNDKDTILYRISLVQCLGFIGFQSMENILHLTNKGVLSPNVVGTRGGAPKWMAWACRSWLVAVSTDFFRLWRENALLNEKRDRGEKISEKEKKDIDSKWYRELITAMSWMPVAVHYSVPGGLPFMNPGLVGFCGMMAGLNNTRNAWAATKD